MLLLDDWKKTSMLAGWGGGTARLILITLGPFRRVSDRTIRLRAGKRRSEIGECIYCGERDALLANEHAVPYGLNGPWGLLTYAWDGLKVVDRDFHGMEAQTVEFAYVSQNVELSGPPSFSSTPNRTPIII